MIKLITHTDLDGISCGILSILAFGRDTLDISYIGYDEVNTVVTEVFENHEKYSHILITDISVNEEVAEKLNTISDKVTLLDHHPTALFLNKYKWADVLIDVNGEKTCGTSLLFIYLFTNESQITQDSLFKYTEMVKKYDTWLWATKYNDTQPRDLNSLLYLYGRDKFIERVVNQINMCGEFSFTETDKLLIELDSIKKDSYIEKKNKEVIIKQIQDYKAGVVFAEQYISELGNSLARLNPELDFIVIINDTVSYRGIKDDIDLGKVAKIYGGGGHKMAAGSQINLKDKGLYLGLLFDI